MRSRTAARTRALTAARTPVRTVGPTLGLTTGPDAGIDGGADGGPDGGPDTQTDAISDSGPDAISDGGSDAAPDAISDSGTDGASDGGADATPDATTDTQTDTNVPLPACGEPLAGTPGTCTVTAGNATTLILGDLVLPNGLLPGGQLLVVGDKITCVGCDCAAKAPGATQISCPGTVISPGLINAHDHITFTQMKPVDHGTIRYTHRHEWRKGLNGFKALPVKQNSHALGDAWGEMRQVMGGATSLFGSGAEVGFQRNLDRDNRLEGLTHAAADYSTFPLGDSGAKSLPLTCSAYKFDDASVAAAQVAYVPHFAEGIEGSAQNEIHCGSGTKTGGVDLIFPTTAMIHGIGLTAADIAMVVGEGAGLVWSPRTNTSLYGFTADAPMYDRLGALVALGTDWTASGSATMLRELACARSWNESYWDSYFSDADLIAMATSSAAELLGFGDVLGSLTVGKVADIAVFDATESAGYKAILDAEVDDVVLVLRGGLVLYGDAPAVAGLAKASDCETLDVCTRAKRICATREIGKSYATLKGEVEADTYEMFFCGVPPGEPSCTPFRPGEFTGVASANDADGDGFADSVDNCPSVFNPPRPLDGLAQPDVDADGDGDACDPCPFDADTTACSSVDPQDLDSDGIANALDNCPSVPNADQKDGDDDQVGDACDGCPLDPNPAGQPCPRSIYDVKSGAAAIGESVSLVGALVTAAGDRSFFLSVDPASAGWAGAPNSGLFVFYPNGALPPVGARVDVTGKVSLFHGQIQLDSAVYTVVDASATLPAPLAVKTADVRVGGKDAKALEGVLVKVADLTVVDASPAGQTGETVAGEFDVSDLPAAAPGSPGLPVDDALFAIDPQPQSGQKFASITGVLRLSWDRNKLQPRSAADVVFGAPKFFAIEPALGTVYENSTDVAAAPPLRVRLTGPALTDTFVPVTSADPINLTVVGGGATVLTGESFAELRFDSVSALTGTPIVITGDLGGVTATAGVEVRSLNNLPQVIAIEPDPLTILIETSTTVELFLDAPAPPGGLDIEIATTNAIVDAPASVNVPEGAFSVELVLMAGANAGLDTLTATTTSGVYSLPFEVVAAPPVGLLLAEVLYDVTGEDTGLEWVRLYNGSTAPVDLAGWSLGHGGVTYNAATYQLAGIIGPGECFVVGGPNGNANNGQPVYGQAKDFNPDLQNSGATADAIGLFHLKAADIKADSLPVDAVVYGGTNADKFKDPDGLPYALPHVDDAQANSSLLRTGLQVWVIEETPSPNECPPIF
ncbi:MAG: amidohydrolase family protein [Myxococcota bacterium]